MGLYSDTRTIDVTTAQIAEMVRAQKKAVELLADNKVNESIVRNTYAFLIWRRCFRNWLCEWQTHS
ncbi:hypothetical protein ACIP9C_20795 [Lysinibacillus sp. NPDC093210]|uniref:hypothetical protein n=1 Tax=Lysinibacillus sp. NPDC093210 TaxID=3364133 RepID=UPI0037FA758C